ncbi:DUF2971 domain-containing protein [Agrobacterium rosae]|uniref:DUF2971 domain-containing protein n=1 Tax=Agrobacterium rosae TaxID=1972867 RepID=UPI00097E00B0|nr:DUF2971 domain-containing protein [Agrobacterium rosae]
MKVSRFTELNDTYDHVGIFVNNGEDLQDLADQRRIFQDQAGIICMSKTYSEPLLWGHYADSHRGMCLIFEAVDNGEWWSIDYIDQRPRVRDYGVLHFKDIPFDEILALSHKKFKNWSYEKEMRRLVALEKYDFADDFYYHEFDEQMVLRGALFGSRVAISERQLHALLEHDRRLLYAFTQPGETRFRVIVDQFVTRKRIQENQKIKFSRSGSILSW